MYKVFRLTMQLEIPSVVPSFPGEKLKQNDCEWEKKREKDKNEAFFHCELFSEIKFLISNAQSWCKMKMWLEM